MYMHVAAVKIGYGYPLLFKFGYGYPLLFITFTACDFKYAAILRSLNTVITVNKGTQRAIIKSRMN